jgi:hypothetical protein
MPRATGFRQAEIWGGLFARSANQRHIARATSPKFTLFASSTFGVVDAFFVRAAVDARGHDDRLHLVASEELQNFAEYRGVFAKVGIAPPGSRFGHAFGGVRADPDDHFARALIVRAVKRDGPYRITAIPPAGFVFDTTKERLRARRHSIPKCKPHRVGWGAFCGTSTVCVDGAKCPTW